MKLKYRLYLGLRAQIRKSPKLYRGYLALKGASGNNLFVDETTDLLIAGYPRSANSFTKLFLQEYAPQLNLAANLHSISSFVDAKKYGTKTLVLVREPLNAISSLVVRYNTLSKRETPNPLHLELALRDYLEFYDYTLKQDWLQLIMNFETVTNDPGRMVQQLQSTLGLGLPYDAERIACCNARVIEQLHAYAKLQDNPGSINLGNAVKEKLKLQIQQQVRLHHDFPRATELFRRVNASCKI